MPSIRSAGGRSIVIPALDVDITNPSPGDERVYANWRELQAAYAMAGRRDDAVLAGGFKGNNGTVLLPAGTIYASFPPTETAKALIDLDDRHAGITIQGAGREKTLLIDPYSGHEMIQIDSRRISQVLDDEYVLGPTTVTLLDPSAARIGDLLYFWNHNTSGTRTTSQQRVKITNIVGTVATFDPAMSEEWNQFRHFVAHKVTNGLSIGNNYADLTDAGTESEFKVNDDIAISDGVGIAEPWLEWVTVTKVETAGGLRRIHFTPHVRQAYVAGRTCLLPAPHMSDITIRDLSVAGPKGDTFRVIGYMTVGLRMSIVNVDFVPDGTDRGDPLDYPSQFGFGSCGHVLINHFRTRGHLTFNLTHDAVLNDIVAQAIGGEEYCFDFFCSNIHIDGWGFIFDTVGPSQRIHLTNALILNHGFQSGQNYHSGFGLAPESRISNVTMMFPRHSGTVVYVPAGAALENVTLDAQLVVQGTNVRLNNLTAPQGVVFSNNLTAPDSSGVMLSPITPTPTNVHDQTAAGQWFRPLFVNSDGEANMPQWSTTGGATPPGLILPSPANGLVPLKVRGANGQTVNLQEWQDHTKAVLFAIRSDGHLASNNIESSAPPGSANKRLLIYNAAGTQIGYIPIHPLS